MLQIQSIIGKYGRYGSETLPMTNVYNVDDPNECILIWICVLITTVKLGNVVTFFAQDNFFLRILLRWPNVVWSYKIRLKKGPDVGKAIFGFWQHLGTFFLIKCWGDDISHLSCYVVTFLYSGVGDDLNTCGKSRHTLILQICKTNSSTCRLIRPPERFVKKFYIPLRSHRMLDLVSSSIFWWTGGQTKVTTLSDCDDITPFDGTLIWTISDTDPNPYLYDWIRIWVKILPEN